MKPQGQLQWPEEIQFFLRLHGMWEGILDIPPPPDPPYDIDTMEPLRWERRRQFASSAARSAQVERQPPELLLDDERILVLDGDPTPPDEFP